MRVDENLRFKKVVLVDGSTMDGDFSLERSLGDLGYAGEVFVVDEQRGIVIPIRAVKILFTKEG